MGPQCREWSQPSGSPRLGPSDRLRGGLPLRALAPSMQALWLQALWLQALWVGARRAQARQGQAQGVQARQAQVQAARRSERSRPRLRWQVRWQVLWQVRWRQGPAHRLWRARLPLPSPVQPRRPAWAQRHPLPVRQQARPEQRLPNRPLQARPLPGQILPGQILAGQLLTGWRSPMPVLPSRVQVRVRVRARPRARRGRRPSRPLVSTAVRRSQGRGLRLRQRERSPPSSPLPLVRRGRRLASVRQVELPPLWRPGQSPPVPVRPACSPRASQFRPACPHLRVPKLARQSALRRLRSSGCRSQAGSGTGPIR
jgi:hypothetical protein